MMSSTNGYDLFFDPYEYLNTLYTNMEYVVFGYEQLVKFWSQNKGKDLRVLEYGGGPVISRLVSACPHVKEIVFADYLEANRQAVRAWIDKDPKAFDWRSNVEFIVQKLEAKSAEEAAKREDELRQKIKAIVPCDIKAEKILDIPDDLQDKYGPPYDVVASTFCIEDVVKSRQEYKTVLTKLVKLLKPGGYLQLHGTLEENQFILGSRTFYNYYLTKELVEESMEEAGLNEIQIELASSYASVHKAAEDGLTDAKDEFFALGRA